MKNKKLNGLYSPTDSIVGFIPQFENKPCEIYCDNDCEECEKFKNKKDWVQ